jgi:predicted DNA-binding protein (UPF0251 family)
MLDFAERFWAKVSKVETPQGCWIWTGSFFNDGYGQFWTPKNARHAHRIAWELTYGPIPPGLHVCHSCDNKRCVRPSHLFLGTPADNSFDMVRKGRQSRGDRHYARLHPECLRRGQQHGMAKLTDAGVRTIREEWLLGVPQRTLARRFGVSQRAVWNILRGRGWKHVTESEGTDGTACSAG